MSCKEQENHAVKELTFLVNLIQENSADAVHGLPRGSGLLFAHGFTAVLAEVFRLLHG